MNQNRKKGRRGIMRQELKAAQTEVAKLEVELGRLKALRAKTNGKTSHENLSRLGVIEHKELPSARRTLQALTRQAQCAGISLQP